MQKNNQTQKVGANSTSIQAGGDMNIYQGVSYSEAKEIALDVFKTNFYQLSEEAATVAKSRAEELTDKFLHNLKEEFPDCIRQMKNPDMQYALFTAQKEYARNGSKEMLEILVNILVDRISIEERSLLQIVLNESLEVIPKLTNSQLDILSLVFIVKYTRRTNLNNFDSLRNYITNTIIPFIKVPEGYSNYQHLEFAGCGSISVLENTIGNSFINHYPGLFSKGFSKEEFDALIKSEVLSEQILIPCLHNKELFQVSSLNDDVLESECLNAGASSQLSEEIKQLQNSKVMSADEAKDFLISLDPAIKQLFDVWDNLPIKFMTLTSVGIAIAYANLQRKISDQFDLSIWI